MNCLNKKVFIFGFLILSTLLFFYVFSATCYPFVVGFILAYLFVPLIDLMSTRLNRSFLCAMFAIFSIAIFIFAGFELLPRLKDYVVYLANKFPEYYDNFCIFFDNLFDSASAIPYKGSLNGIKVATQKYFDQNVNILSSIVNGLMAQKNTIAAFFSFFIIMPISFFYFARDWDVVSSKVYKFIPLRQHAVLHKIFSVIRKSLFRFIHAQCYVVAILSLYYMSILFVLGIPTSLFLGLLSGIFSFIPFIGAFLACFIVIFVSAPYLTLTTLCVLIVAYFIGQLLEGYVLSPRFIGSGTGLHPLWILFAFFAGYQLLGIMGVLISIPVMTILRGIINLLIPTLHASQIYKQ